MVTIPNTKDIRVGDKVQVKPRLSPRTLYEGTVVYVHPTAGWATVKLARSAERRESDKPGVAYTVIEHEFFEPYNSSFAFSELMHLDDVSGRAPLKPVHPLRIDRNENPSSEPDVKEAWDEEDEDESEDEDISMSGDPQDPDTQRLWERLWKETSEKEAAVQKEIVARRLRDKPITYAIIYEDGRDTKVVTKTKPEVLGEKKRTAEDLKKWMQELRAALGPAPCQT